MSTNTLKLVSPTKGILYTDIPLETLEKTLTYVDKRVEFELLKLTSSLQKIKKFSPNKTALISALEARQDALRKDRTKTLVTVENGLISVPSGLSERLAKQFGFRVEVCYQLPNFSGPLVVRGNTKQSREYQAVAHDLLLRSSREYGGPAGVELATGCHRKGEKVLMFDGSIRCVEEVRVGDLLMGPDSKPRTVLGLCNGIDSMYKLETKNRQTYFVNGAHVLVLRRTNDGKKHLRTPKKQIVEMSLDDYLTQTKHFKHLHKLYAVGVDFPAATPPMVDPYFLGVLLGDGCMLGSIQLTTMDEELVSCFREQATVWGLVFREGKKKSRAQDFFLVLPKEERKRGRNLLKAALRKLGVLGLTSANKFIPDIYKTGSKEVRRSILAGLLDTDGSMGHNGFDFISKSRRLSEDICFVARSLGLRATISVATKGCQTGAIGTYHRVSISGNTDTIPTRLKRKQAYPRKQKKDVTSFGFSVEKVADAESYYGFRVDGDHRYLMSDFVVTHNSGKSWIIASLVRTLGLGTTIMAPSRSIARQLYQELCSLFGAKLVGLYGDGQKEYSKLVTVGIDDSLTKIKSGTPAWNKLSKNHVFIADESHLCPSKTLAHVCYGLASSAPYRYFFSGTQIRNDGLDLVLEGIVGRVVLRMGVRELVQEGYLATPNFRMAVVSTDSTLRSSDANAMTRAHLYYNPHVNRTAGFLAMQFVRQLSSPVVILVEEIEQFSKLLPHLQGLTVGFAHGPLSPENVDLVPEPYRSQTPEWVVEEFNAGRIQVLVGTSCIATGTDIQVAEAGIYLMGGKSEIKIRQGVGRETRGGRLANVLNPWTGKQKVSFVHVDFDVVDPNMSPSELAGFVPHKHAIVRSKVYKDIFSAPERVSFV